MPFFFSEVGNGLRKLTPMHTRTEQMEKKMHVFGYYLFVSIIKV